MHRYRCRDGCGRTFTQLHPWMLPHKHYNAFEIEDTLSEDASDEGHAGGSSGAEESTIRRWKGYFRAVLPVLATKLEVLVALSLDTRISLVENDGALQRVYRAVSHLERVSDGMSRLGRAFHLSMAHPLCLGWPWHGV